MRGLRRVRPFEGSDRISRTALGLAHQMRGLIRAFGVNPQVFQLLLAVELTTETRRARRAKQDQVAGSPFGAGLVWTFLINLAFGGFASIVLGILDDPLWGMAFALAMFQVMLTMMLVGDYLPSFVDTAKIEILAPLPVDGRDVVAARIGYVMIFVAVNAIALSIAPLIVGSACYGAWPFVPVWCTAAALATATCLGLSFGIFVLAMRVFDLDRFRDLLLYGQIGVVVIVFGGLQLLPRLVTADMLRATTGQRSWWLALIPPFHGSSLLELTTGEPTPLLFVLAGLAVLVPVVAIYSLLRLAKRGFVTGLAAMAMAARSGSERLPIDRRPIRDLLLRTQLARAGYDFFTALSRRERNFRMRTYPMLAMSAVLGVAWAVRGNTLDVPEMLCGAIYLLGLYSPAFVVQSRGSDNHEARWLFEVQPERTQLREFVHGALVALLITFVAPSVVLMFGLVLAIGGFQLFEHALVAVAAVVAMNLLSIRIAGGHMPFTEETGKNLANSNIGTMLALMALGGCLAGLHVAATLLGTWGLAALVTAYASASAVLMRSISRIRCKSGWLYQSA